MGKRTLCTTKSKKLKDEKIVLKKLKDKKRPSKAKNKSNKLTYLNLIWCFCFYDCLRMRSDCCNRYRRSHGSVGSGEQSWRAVCLTLNHSDIYFVHQEYSIVAFGEYMYSSYLKAKVTRADIVLIGIYGMLVMLGMWSYRRYLHICILDASSPHPPPRDWKSQILPRIESAVRWSTKFVWGEVGWKRGTCPCCCISHESTHGPGRPYPWPYPAATLLLLFIYWYSSVLQQKS